MFMSPVAPQFSRYENNTAATPNAASGTAVSNPVVTINTKATTWTQLLAASAFDAQLVVITVAATSASATDTSTLLDIGIGASTAEEVLIPDLLVGYVTGGSTSGGTRTYMFPLYVPSGSRISARSQSVRLAGSTTVLIELYGGPRNQGAWWYGQQVTAYGVSAADSGAVTVTPGGTGAEGTAVAIGTTTSAHKALVVGVQGVGLYTATGYVYLDVGIDTASTSWLRQDAHWFTIGSTEYVGQGYVPWWPIFASIPNGTVLVCGAEHSGTAQTFDVAYYGVS